MLASPYHFDLLSYDVDLRKITTVLALLSIKSTFAAHPKLQKEELEWPTGVDKLTVVNLLSLKIITTATSWRAELRHRVLPWLGATVGSEFSAGVGMIVGPVGAVIGGLVGGRFGWIGNQRYKLLDLRR